MCRKYDKPEVVALDDANYFERDYSHPTKTKFELKENKPCMSNVKNCRKNYIFLFFCNL